MNLRRLLCLTGILLPFLTPGQTLAATPVAPTKPVKIPGDAFAQLSSPTDQNPGGLVQFQAQDALKLMSATKNSVIVQQAGTYLIIASPQVTATGDGGCLNAWLVVNGKDVKNSGVRICQAKAGNTNVLVSQVALPLNQGDTIQVKTSGKNAKLDAISPPGEPLIPAIILTVFGLSYK